MKNKWLIILIITTTGFAESFAQSSKVVPSEVQNAFNIQFAGAQKLKWQMEEDGIWEAEFRQNGDELSATFAADGQWKETETEIEKDELPAIINSVLQTKFMGMRIREAAIVQRPDLSHGFEVELRGGKEITEVLLNDQGDIISQEKADNDKN